MCVEAVLVDFPFLRRIWIIYLPKSCLCQHCIQLSDHVFVVRGAFFIGGVVLNIQAYVVSLEGFVAILYGGMSSIDEGKELLKAKIYG